MRYSFDYQLSSKSKYWTCPPLFLAGRRVALSKTTSTCSCWQISDGSSATRYSRSSYHFPDWLRKAWLVSQLFAAWFVGASQVISWQLSPWDSHRRLSGSTKLCHTCQSISLRQSLLTACWPELLHYRRLWQRKSSPRTSVWFQLWEEAAPAQAFNVPVRLLVRKKLSQGSFERSVSRWKQRCHGIDKSCERLTKPFPASK